MSTPETSAGDDVSTMAELRQLVAEFVADRDWSKYHAPKNVSMALAIEAAELMEHFQWISPEDSRDIPTDPEKLHEVAEELSDVFGYTLALANELGIDLSQAFRAKMIKNSEKYPVDKFHGRYERPKRQ